MGWIEPIAQDLVSIAHVAETRLAMNDNAHIVVVDDEPDIRETIEDYLGLHGFAVSTADGGKRLREIVAERPVDLVLLDLRMPGEDGLSLARYLREHTQAAVIMVTAVGETVDRIVGLEMGADDYVAKPFDLRELLARIKSVLRRLRSEPAGRASRSENEVPFGRFLLNLDSHKLYALDGSEIALTSMEFDLLHAFARHPNRVLNRDQLLDLAHHQGWEPFDRSIDIRIARIRRKIEEDPGKPQVIKTVRGAGYVFVTGSK